MRDASVAHGALPPVEKRKPAPAHQWRRRSSSDPTASQCVFDLVKRTTPVLVVKRKPVANGSGVRYREALRRRRVLTADDPTILEIPSGSYHEDFGAVRRKVSLDSRIGMASFEDRMARQGEESHPPVGHQTNQLRLEWSPDATTLSADAAVAAAQSGGMGAGPRLTVEHAYKTFRVLKLAEKNIKEIDPAFAHFENLTELDLGRNRLKSLGFLPAGLVLLSCAANELQGPALDAIRALPDLVSLDLSYNCLTVEALPMPASSPRDIPPSGKPSARRKGQQRATSAARASPAELSLSDKFASLQHLDLSWNLLCDLLGVLQALRPLQGTLRHLFLAGNPLSLLPYYRERILSSCGPRLLVLDDLHLTQEERQLHCAWGQGGAFPASAGTDELSHRESRTRARAPRQGCPKALELIHLGVEILRLSNLPDLGIEESRESVAEEGAPAAAPGGAAKDQAGDGDGANQAQPPKQWGEVEFLIPGHSAGPTTTSGIFEWTVAECFPPGKTMDSQAAGDAPQVDHTGSTGENIDALADAGTGNGEWKVTAAMLPSKNVRDGVHLRGLGVFLFAVDDRNVDESGREENQGSTPTYGEPAPPGGSSTVDEVKDDRVGNREEETPTKHPQEQAQAASSCHDTIETRGRCDSRDGGSTLRCRHRRRRLVGRGYLTLSSLLDPVWMNEQRLRPQQSRESPRGKEEGSGRGAAGSTSVGLTLPEAETVSVGLSEGGWPPRDTPMPPEDALVCGTCSLVLEPWVEGLAASAADESARASADGGEEDRDTDETLQAPVAAEIEVRVTLNSRKAIRAFAEAAGPVTV